MKTTHFASKTNVWTYTDCMDGTYDMSLFHIPSNTYRYVREKKEFGPLPSTFPNFTSLIHHIGKGEKQYPTFELACEGR